MLAYIVVTVFVAIVMDSAGVHAQRLRGTLVVAVPVKEGLVTCADKRLFNIDDGTYTDYNIKIRKVSDKVLFVATSTIGFYDRKSKRIAFDAFRITEEYISRNRFSDDGKFWDGLKNEIRIELRKYFADRDYSEWPESDRANNNLLFNLIFYSVDGGQARSKTVQVFYEKRRAPLVNVTGPVGELIWSPKLAGKSRDLMAYISQNPALVSDPVILKFDQSRFDIQKASTGDAVEFSRRLFRLANTGVPKAQISATFDCALLGYRGGFRWIEGGTSDKL